MHRCQTVDAVFGFWLLAADPRSAPWSVSCYQGQQHSVGEKEAMQEFSGRTLETSHNSKHMRNFNTRAKRSQSTRKYNINKK